ncbi:MAG: prepilin-type N-terminal cleavage/methylation domain-containing protein [Proteobacteria bacterium]|nr:MAG: prepilin-type N-terminal cleavage/methylation domain-containing protein [Pseudomonadota bacterium]
MTLRSLPKLDQRGFTLMEILMVLLLLGVLSVVSLDVLSPNINETRFQATTEKMRRIQHGLVGNPNLAENNVRTSFGYLGDIGSLPTAVIGINGLITNPSLPAYSANATARFGLGWNGPYLSGENSNAAYLVDGWGNNFVYSPAANPPTLVSLGSDAAAGGTGFAQDISVTFPTATRLATITGFVCNTGAPFKAAAQVELNYPDGSGGLTQSLATLAAADAGFFSFANIPFGVRSLTIYIPTKAAAANTIGPVILTVDKPNYLVPCNAIDINP